MFNAYIKECELRFNQIYKNMYKIYINYLESYLNFYQPVFTIQ
jgi:hypothetical protein